MQTTLLAVGIAIIMGLLAALVGPFFMPWSDYRSVFEARASRLIGMPVSITGAIDARLLPVPSLTLRGVEVQNPLGEKRLKIRELGIEFALGALVRGEWRATELRLVGPEANVGLDAAGRLDWAASPAGIDPDALSIDRLSVEDGRISLADAGSSSRVTLERLWFTGDVRSLNGPVKGEGGFVAGDERHAYRISSGRLGDDGVRLRLAVDPADRPVSADADGILRFENGSPRFEGAMTLSRLPGVTLVRGRAVSSEPWRVTSRVKATPAAALFEQLELLYGPEPRALKLSGAAELKFGRRAQLEAVMSARQLDLDKLVSLPESTQRLPLVALRTVAETLGDFLQPTIPIRLGIGIDALTIGGGTVQTIRGDLTADAAGWDVETLEFRAPGFAQMRASGRLTMTGRDFAFTGPASIEATEPKALMAWIEGRSATAAASQQIGPFRAAGEITLASDRVAVERLKAEIDRKSVAGRFAYSWGVAGQPPRLDAELNAAEFDLDGAAAMVKAALPGADLDVMPAEIALALDVGRATLAGIAARNAKAKLKLDANGLVVERLTVEDLAGASVDLTARMEGPWAAPHGALTFDLAGPRLDGVVAVLEKFAPRSADALRAASPQLSPAKLRVTLTVEAPAQPAVAAQSTAKARIEGTAGMLRVALTSELAGDPANLRNAELKLDGRFEADHGRALAALARLDDKVTVGGGPGSLRLTASGPLGGDLRVEARLLASGVDVFARGGVRFGDDGVSGQAETVVSAADLIPLRAPMGRVAQAAPLAFKARIGFTRERVEIEDFTATVAGTTVNGRLALALARPLRIEGRLDADTIDGSALLAALVGMPPVVPGRTAATPSSVWSAQPFGARLLADMEGQIELRASRAALNPSLELRQFEALLRFAENETAVEDIKGILAGGRLLAHLTMPRGPEGTSLDARLALSGADIARLLPGEARSPLAGKVSLQIEAKGSGRSPASLAGALGGAGTLSFESIELTGLDPRVFEVVTHATDQGLGVDGPRIKAVVETALEHGRLRVARADGALTLTAGQLRLSGLLAKGDRADVGINASVDLPQWMLDARLALMGNAGADGPAAGRPEIFVALKGPLGAPKRSIDVSGLVGWLTMRSVELQARRLEVLEAERRAAEAAKAPPRTEPMVPPRSAAPEPAPVAAPVAVAPPPQVLVPEVSPVQSALPRSAVAPVAVPSAFPAPAPQAALPHPTESSPTEPLPAAPLPRLRRSPPAAAPRATAPEAAVPSPRRAVPNPLAEPAPALPPPIDIRPAPGSRRPNAQRPTQHRQSAGGDTRIRPPADVPSQPWRGGVFDLFGAR